MKQALPVVVLCTVLSVAVSFLVATSMRPSGAPAQAEPLEAGALQKEGAETDLDVTDLRMAIASLEAKVEFLERARPAAARNSLAPPAATGTEGVSLAASLARLDPEGEQALRAEVTKVIAQIEEEKEAEAREEELVKRGEEAYKAYKEYDEVDLNLSETVSKLGDKLGLGTADRRDMKSLLALQNDRNRQMTSLWSAGDTSDEELGQIFQANRAKHRAEVMALVGGGGIGRYRKFLREGGLGGRFAFFTGPRQDWAAKEGQ